MPAWECFDSHVHLDFGVFDATRPSVIDRARAAGVTRMFVPGCNPVQWRRLDELWGGEFVPVGGGVAAGDISIRVGVGLHPYFTTEHPHSKRSALQSLIADIEHHVRLLSAVALGEMGLDKNKGAPIDRQVELFEAQLELAKDLELPLVLHQVGVQTEFLGALKRVGVSDVGGVVHGFSGDLGWAKALMKLGLFLGVGAGIVAPARDRLRVTVSQLPLEHIVVETDAPDGRFGRTAQQAGIRSEPEDVRLVVSRLSELLGLDAAVVAGKTAENASRLFRF